MAILISVLIGLFVIYALFFQGGHWKFFDQSETTTEQNQYLKPISPDLNAPIQGQIPLDRPRHSENSQMALHLSPVITPLIRPDREPGLLRREGMPLVSPHQAESNDIRPLRSFDMSSPPVPGQQQLVGHNDSPPVPSSADNSSEQGDQAQ